MENRIEYTTILQQIESLKEKGLGFGDEDSAKTVLQRYGYYNIINSYKEPYQVVIGDERKYISGTTFEQIYSMFTLDHNLRNSIMASMLELEECLRAATAALNGILGTLRNNTGSDKDPIKYYREKYPVIPPWILLKGTYFSTLINLIKC